MLDLVTRMTAVEAEEAIRKDPKLTCLAKLPTGGLAILLRNSSAEHLHLGCRGRSAGERPLFPPTWAIR